MQLRRARNMTVVAVVLVGAAGAGAALADTAAVGPTVYYAETGAVGVIECAEKWGHVDTDPPGAPSDVVRARSRTSTFSGVFCPNALTAPQGYISAQATLYRGNGVLCGFTGWLDNSAGTNSRTADLYFPTDSIPGCDTATQFYTFAESDAALNFSWRYSNHQTATRTNN